MTIRSTLGRSEPIRVYCGRNALPVQEALANESALIVTINGQKEFTLYRSPGHDAELMTGALFAWQRISELSEIKEIRRSSDENLEIRLGPAKTATARRSEEFPPPRPASSLQISPDLLMKLSDRLMDLGLGSEDSLGCHQGYLLDGEGEVHLRHQDVDAMGVLYKLVGAALLMNQFPLRDYILVVDFRLRGPMMELCAKAGIQILITQSVPTALARQIALEQGMTVVGRLRTRAYQVYAGAERIHEPLFESRYRGVLQ